MMALQKIGKLNSIDCGNESVMETKSMERDQTIDGARIDALNILQTDCQGSVGESREIMKEYPRYYILGEWPVKLIMNDKGEMGAFAFNWETGVFELNWDAYLAISKPGSDVESVSEIEFEKHVENLRVKVKERKLK